MDILTDLSIMIASHCSDYFRIKANRQKDVQDDGWKDKQTLNTSDMSNRFIDKSQQGRQAVRQSGRQAGRQMVNRIHLLCIILV